MPDLIRQNLVDEDRLMIHPIVLGTGKRLFREGGSPTRMRLIHSKASGSLVFIATHGRAARSAGGTAVATEVSVSAR